MVYVKGNVTACDNYYDHILLYSFFIKVKYAAYWEREGVI